VTVLAEVGGVLADEQDETESPRMARRRVCNNKLKDSLSRVDAKQAAVLDLNALKKKAPADRSAWRVEQELIRRCSRAPRLSRGEQLARKGLGQVS